MEDASSNTPTVSHSIWVTASYSSRPAVGRGFVFVSATTSNDVRVSG